MGIGHTELAGDLRDGQAGERALGRGLVGRREGPSSVGVIEHLDSGLRPRTQGRWEASIGGDRAGHRGEPWSSPSHDGGALGRARRSRGEISRRVDLTRRPEDEGAGALHGRVQMSSGDVSSQSNGGEGVPGVEHLGSQCSSRPQRQGGARAVGPQVGRDHDSAGLVRPHGRRERPDRRPAAEDAAASPLQAQQDTKCLEPDGVPVSGPAREEQRCRVDGFRCAQRQHLQPATDDLARETLGVEVEVPALPQVADLPHRREQHLVDAAPDGRGPRRPGPARRALARGRSRRTRPRSPGRRLPGSASETGWSLAPLDGGCRSILRRRVPTWEGLRGRCAILHRFER